MSSCSTSGEISRDIAQLRVYSYWTSRPCAGPLRELVPTELIFLRPPSFGLINCPSAGLPYFARESRVSPPVGDFLHPGISPRIGASLFRSRCIGCCFGRQGPFSFELRAPGVAPSAFIVKRLRLVPHALAFFCEALCLVPSALFFVVPCFALEFSEGDFFLSLHFHFSGSYHCRSFRPGSHHHLSQGVLAGVGRHSSVRFSTTRVPSWNGRRRHCGPIRSELGRSASSVSYAGGRTHCGTPRSFVLLNEDSPGCVVDRTPGHCRGRRPSCSTLSVALAPPPGDLGPIPWVRGRLAFVAFFGIVPGLGTIVLKRIQS